MKKTITTLSIALCAIFNTTSAQNVADFESLTLAADTFYEVHSNTPWQTNNATFRYLWDATFPPGYWDAGFSYTNKQDSSDGSYHNIYGAITKTGYNGSSKYVTASQGYGGEKMYVKLAPTEASVSGFYVTNTTYGYKTMKRGGGPARAFGDTLHTHSGMQPGNYPDWFKLSVYGYKNGLRKTDTVEFYLADYRFTNNTQDYIVKNWQWVNCTVLGEVDSISFKLYSSDEGMYGINNPTYFSIDNFTTILSVGVNELTSVSNISMYPNPFSDYMTINYHSNAVNTVSFRVYDISGKEVIQSVTHNVSGDHSFKLETATLESGVYFVEISDGVSSKTIKCIK